MTWTVNTSNPGKQEEYLRYLGPETKILEQDLREPCSDALTIVRYKASQFSEKVLVDDVSLDLGDEIAATLIKWNLKELHQHIGNSAVFRCWLAYRMDDKVYAFVAETRGRIVHPRGHSFGFNPFFLPSESNKTFGEEIPDELNPRWKSIQLVLSKKPSHILPLLTEWTGKFQKEKI